MSKPQEIKIHSSHKKQIALELETTTQTVLTAIKYFNNSPLAKRIRQRAKELLNIEASKIED